LRFSGIPYAIEKPAGQKWLAGFSFVRCPENSPATIWKLEKVAKDW